MGALCSDQQASDFALCDLQSHAGSNPAPSLPRGQRAHPVSAARFLCQPHGDGAQLCKWRSCHPCCQPKVC